MNPGGGGKASRSGLGPSLGGRAARSGLTNGCLADAMHRMLSLWVSLEQITIFVNLTFCSYFRLACILFDVTLAN